MPVTTRSRRVQQEAAPCPLTLQMPSNRDGASTLPDGTIVRVTTSDTGEGKHWRWVYSETGDNGSKSNPPPPESTVTFEEFPQCDSLVTPVSSMPLLPPSIQHARRERHYPRPADAPKLIHRHLAPDSTIPWETDLDSVTRDSPTAKFGRLAMGPEGTWLVDDEGNYIVMPMPKSPSFRYVSQDHEDHEGATSNQ
jgi:hypothetical protein